LPLTIKRYEVSPDGAWHEFENHSCRQGRQHHLHRIDSRSDGGSEVTLHASHRCDAGERLAGILSERDIVRTMADVGNAALQLSVAQVMTRNVSTCDVNDSVRSVMERMTKGKFRHMPVLDNNRLAGVVSIGDALKWQIETIREHLHQLELTVAELNLMRL
jgi:CBS domain-containing protein